VVEAEDEHVHLRLGEEVLEEARQQRELTGRARVKMDACIRETVVGAVDRFDSID